MYNAAREGNKEVLEEAISTGLPANLTNEKGDTLVSSESKLAYRSSGALPLWKRPTPARVRPAASGPPHAESEGRSAQRSASLVGCICQKKLTWV